VRCIAWRDLADHICESLRKGDRVIVTGTLRERQYEKDDQKRSIWELTVSEAGPSLKFVTTKSQKAERASAPSGGEDWPPQDDQPPY
jgi:single-strand DNA-binding protein